MDKQLPIRQSSNCRLQRKIIHLDMDAFFASIEQRDNPLYQGKPLVVGGAPDSRSVVAAASYEARKFGIKSAMPCAQAYRLCPQTVFVPPRIKIYRNTSRVIMAILREFTDLVEPMSLDEAFMDVTINKKYLKYASQVANAARKKIYECTGLTSSAGVAPNKFLAKLASGMNKPNGLTVVKPEDISDFIIKLPVRKIPGIGRKTEEQMARLGISTIAQLQDVPLERLTKIFGKSGSWFYDVARGIDDRRVVPDRERKSIGSEDTFEVDLNLKEEILDSLLVQCHKAHATLLKKELLAKTLTVKIKFNDFTTITRSQTLTKASRLLADFEKLTISLLEKTEAGRKPVRLTGISLSGLEDVNTMAPNVDSSKQLTLDF